MKRITTLALSFCAVATSAMAHPGHGGANEVLHALEHSASELAPAALIVLGAVLGAALLRRT